MISQSVNKICNHSHVENAFASNEYKQMLRDKNILTGGVKGDNIVSDYLVKWPSPE